jgi:hypothetical protein
MVIEEIIQKSKTLEMDEEVLTIAKQRFDLWNPPWKNWSYGDAINWELLLKWINSTASDNIEALFFITQDKDYVSHLDPTRFNSFLSDEWFEKKKFPISFYWKLTDFFREKFPDIQLAKELHKSLLIEGLCDSGSFANTKSILRKLIQISDFTRDELNKIIQGAVYNRQIYWISSETRYFLNLIIAWRREEIEPDLLMGFDTMYNPTPTEDEENFNIEDIPF